MLQQIIFDFDGVIIDSCQICYESFCMTHKKVDLQEFKNLFNGNFFAEEKKTKTAVDSTSNHTIQDALEYAHQQRLQKPPYQNISNIIHKLSHKYELSIITSSISNHVHDYLQQYHLAEYFKQIRGADKAKSKVKKFKQMIKAGSDPKKIVFITDTVGDILEARTCGIPSIAVTRGFHDADRLFEANPRFMATKPDEIPTYIDNFEQNSHRLDH